ncbi:SulP family inorganic anion transporter [Actinomadura rupiterrae]|uniref:SulP family inorganic anion transporter n=1 Tax=Actinomadura rupiterrae TaxID=559627 RepID=UPI0020A40903|nr:SulP family inorganic anion transporter [Actinomadura rupiterrae]MCP2335795.1 carbonic anhydrase [Actinomadura rupiterrae]
MRHDVGASFVVFLVAVPLSLGIAVASGAPVAAGLVAAIVGGVVGGLAGGAPLQVSGPAAGLTVIVAELVHAYGWRAACGVTLLAGLVQALLGAARVARAALAVSPAVVHGMLAGVGLVLVLSQLHVVLGGRPQGSAVTNLMELPRQLVRAHAPSTLVALGTIAVLLLWMYAARRYGGRGRLAGVLRMPAAVPAILIASAGTWALGWDVPHVDMPRQLLAGWRPPAFPDAPVHEIVGAVAAVAVVAAVESLLCAVAMDRRRPAGVPRADLDRELVGQGAANALSGLLGGLPVAGVIVRSTANAAAGARSRASTVLHGVWILAAAVCCASVVERIPLPALAGLLVVLGFRMLDTARLRDLWDHRELPVHLATAAGVVLLGLGEGVLVGIALAGVLALRRLTALTVRVEEAVPSPDERPGQATWHVVVEGTLTFLGVPRLSRALGTVPAGAGVDLDLNVDFMDHAAFDAVHQWRLAHERLGGRVDIDEVHETWYERAVTGDLSGQRKSPPGSRWWAPWANRRRRPPESVPAAAQGTPSAALLSGIREYQGQTAALVRPIMAELAFEQKPEHLFITCVDSRVVPNIITASGPGDLFINRNVGNMVPRYHAGLPDDSVAATVEYALEVLGIRTITVCGHSNCGAMAALLAGGKEVEHLTSLTKWLQHGKPTLARFVAADPEPDQAPLTRLCQLNVVQQLENLETYPWLRALVDSGELELVGLYLDLETADVHYLDRASGRFSPVPGDTRTPV